MRLQNDDRREIDARRAHKNERSEKESESGSETFSFDRHIRPECVKVTEKSLTRIVFSRAQ